MGQHLELISCDDVLVKSSTNFRKHPPKFGIASSQFQLILISTYFRSMFAKPVDFVDLILSLTLATAPPKKLSRPFLCDVGQLCGIWINIFWWFCRTSFGYFKLLLGRSAPIEWAFFFSDNRSFMISQVKSRTSWRSRRYVKLTKSRLS